MTDAPRSQEPGLRPFSEMPRSGLVSAVRTFLSTGAGRVDMLSPARCYERARRGGRCRSAARSAW